MKATIFFSLIAAMLVSSLSAFAYDRDLKVSQGANLTMGAAKSGAMQNIASMQHWVGKRATQLIKVLGDPSYASVGKNGRMTYDFVQEPQHVGPIPTYQFIIGRDGNVAAERLIL